MLLVALLLLALMWPVAAANPAATRVPNPATVRAARPADDVAHPGSLTEWWTVRAFDTHGDYVIVSFFDRPEPLIEVRIRDGAYADDLQVPGMVLQVQPHAGPGVTLATHPDNAPPEPSSLSYEHGAYVVNLGYPRAHGRLVLRPSRARVTAGPWTTGKEPVGSNDRPKWIPATRWWSVPAATGTVSGNIQLDSHRMSIAGWRGYHDHTWGMFRFTTTSWFHADFALVSPSASEAWLVYGLERGIPYGAVYRYRGDDSLWRGLLVHVTTGGVNTCRARVRRSGWLTGQPPGEPTYSVPRTIRASCGGRALAVSPAFGGRMMFGTVMWEIRVDGTLARGTGWYEHTAPATPPGP
jgi:hypothetical protein